MFSLLRPLSLSLVSTVPKGSSFSPGLTTGVYCAFLLLFTGYSACVYCFSQHLALQNSMYLDSTNITHSNPNVSLPVFRFLPVPSGQAKKDLLLKLSHYCLLMLSLQQSYPQIIARY